MDEQEWLAKCFEEHRSRLRAVAYRMLGSTGEAEDAVQEAWLRLARSGASGIENLGGWLTTVVARVCLNMLRSRGMRREESLSEPQSMPLSSRVVPDPIVGRADSTDPEQEALLANAVGLALLVVFETLTPAERLAFVLHDTFGMTFEEIAPIVGRSPAATRQLASRARRRVRGATAVPDADLARQQEVVDAFLAASREGDFGALLAVLDPDVVLRADTGGVPREIHGAADVANQALFFSRLGGPGRVALPARVNGAAGLVTRDADGRPFSVLGFTVAGGKIVEIDILADPERLSKLDLSALDW
jgi:RNA polymerase sigma factor (sigma-70 family)